jgi:hypothetical protein
LFFAIGLFALGCAPRASTTEVRFAIPAPATGPAVRVGDALVLTTHVNLQEPISVAVAGGEVTVTAAARGHRGWTYALDPLTHAAPSLTPFDYADHPSSSHPGQRNDTDRVRLHDDRTLRVWTDAPAGRVVAQIFDPDGTAHGPEITVSGDADVLGVPHAITADGRHVVVTYVTSNEAGFSLVARALEAP